VVPVRTMPFDAIEGRRIAGVSSFGFSGTNAHLVLEEAPQRVAPKDEAERAGARSGDFGKDRDGAGGISARYIEHLAVTPGSVRRHLLHGRMRGVLILLIAWRWWREIKPRRFRCCVRLSGPARAAEDCVSVYGPGQSVCGDGPQLYESSALFRDCIDRCGVAGVLYGSDTAAIHRTEHAQVSLFAVECGLTELWHSWGVTLRL